MVFRRFPASRLFSVVQSCQCSLLPSSSSFTRLIAANDFIRSFSTSFSRNGLMEFFDDPKNWGAPEVRSGRSWTKDELRTKSNTDLHKLWYVLYKEKNMLLTMREECKNLGELFPNPERIEKVEESMEHLESVVAERDKAVKLLEYGITGQPPEMTCYSGLGLRYTHKYQEHLIPYWHNPKHFPRRYVNDQISNSQRLFLHKYWALNAFKRQKKDRYLRFRMHQAKEFFPDSEVWKKHDPSSSSTKDIYHSNMSD